MVVFDAVWIWYTATVAALAALCSMAPVAGGSLAFAGIHLLLLVVVLLLRRCTARRSPWVERWTRGIFALMAMPVIFSSIGLVLPAIHPEPFEWTWLAADRALFGGDPTIALQGLLTPPLTELLQWVYAAFYLLPIAVVLVSAVRRDGRGFDRSLVTITFCFMFSYLGYLLWPTLPPFRFLEHTPLQGLWLGDALHSWIDQAELNHWDCFPSGHTMLSIVALILAWRHVRALFWPLLPIVALLVFSTVALRYHYVCDVLAGLLAVVPGVWLSDRVLVESAPQRYTTA